MTIYPGPIAPQNNPTIEPENFKPSVFVISAISMGQTTTITTSTDNNYVIGQQVRLLIPTPFGAYGLNNAIGYVISLPASNQATINISSAGMDAFVASPIYYTTSPQVIAVGDFNSGVISSTGRITSTVIPGSFQNIS